MTVLRDYWSGVIQRLQAEVDVFARLIQHSGEQGRENEQALQRLLAALLPLRIGLGTGMIIDSQDRYSKQTDVLLFDAADEPSLMAQTTQLLFPVETVLAAIEVKTTLRSEDIEDVARKMSALRELSPAHDHYPVAALFADDTNQSPKALSSRLESTDRTQRPDLGLVLKLGILFGTEARLATPPDAYSVGITPLRDAESGAWVPIPEGAREVFEVKGRIYPIVKVEGVSYAADASRALLLYVESLLTAIAEMQARRPPVFGSYLSDTDREIVYVPKATEILTD